MAKQQNKLGASLKRLRKQKPIVLRPEVLLCPNVPKPLHGVAPRVVLGNKWWDETRKAAYASARYHCIACGVHKSQARYRQWLEGHEIYDVDYAKGRMVYVETVPLCYCCHNYIHDGRMQALLDQRKFPASKMVAILQHGDRVLAAAGLFKPSHRERDAAIINSILCNEVAAWKDWRLVIDGVEYKPKFKTEAQWRLAMTKV